MREKGRIVELKGDMAVVSIIRSEACAHCNACNKGKLHLLNASNICNAKVNDWVYIEIQSDAFAKGIAILYGLPLIMFLTGIAIGYFMSQVIGLIAAIEFVSFISGIIFALSSYFLIKKIDKTNNFNSCMPVIKEISTAPLKGMERNL